MFNGILNFIEFHKWMEIIMTGRSNNNIHTDFIQLPTDKMNLLKKYQQELDLHMANVYNNRYFSSNIMINTEFLQ